MKKLLAMALGAMLAISAVSAYAASAIDFSGYYKAYFFNPYNVTHNNRGQEEWNDSDQFFMSRLNIDVTFQPTDEISVFWQFRGPDKNRWGTGYSINSDRSGGFLFTRQVYGQINQDWGTVKIGRIDGIGDQGLTSLGYVPGSAGDGYIYRAPFDNLSDPWDAIYYTNAWDNGFGLNAFYAKAASGGTVNNRYKDADYDRISVEGVYKWDGGGVSMAVMMDRDYAGKNDVTLGANTYKGVGRRSAWYINPAFAHSFGEWSIHAEMMFGWGKEYVPGQNKSHQIDASGYAFYADVDYNYGPGNVALMGWYASGTEWSDDEDNGFVGMGDFAPLVVAFYDNTLGNGRWSSNAAWDSAGPGNGNGPNNNWGVAFTGQHAANDYLTIDWAVGYTSLIYSNYRFANPVTTERHYSGTDLGWEVDLGMTIQLLDNLQFSTMFGYMFVGDAYDVVTGYDTNNSPQWRGADDSYVWVNTLAFTF